MIRPALPADVRTIRDLVEPLSQERILRPYEMVGYFEAVQEFLVSPAAPAGSVATRNSWTASK